jgi:hypothetical protein
MGVALSLFGLRRHARRVFAQARQAAEATESQSEFAQLRWYESLAAVAQGDWATAEAALAEVVQISTTLHDWRLLGEGLNFLQLALHYQGAFTRSQEVNAQLAQLVHTTGNPIHAIWVQDVRGLNALRLGRSDEALGLLEQSRVALEHLRVGGPTYCVIDDGLTSAYLGRGQLTHAEAISDDTIKRIARPFPVIYLEVFGLSAIAEVALASWEAARDNGALRARARATCADLLRGAWIFPVGQPRAWRCWGRYQDLAGRRQAAVWGLHRSLAAACQLGMPYEEARAREALGYLMEGKAAQAQLAHAVALYARLGATDEIRRVRRRKEKP